MIPVWSVTVLFKNKKRNIDWSASMVIVCELKDLYQKIADVFKVTHPGGEDEWNAYITGMTRLSSDELV